MQCCCCPQAANYFRTRAKALCCTNYGVRKDYKVSESLKKMHRSNDRMLCDLIIRHNALKSYNMGHVIEYCYLTSHSIFCRPRTAQIMEEQISKCMPYHYYHHHYTIVVQFYATIIG